MECRTLSSRLTSKEGSSKVMVSGGSEVRYVSKGLMTLGHTPSGRDGNRQWQWGWLCRFRLMKQKVRSCMNLHWIIYKCTELHEADAGQNWTCSCNDWELLGNNEPYFRNLYQWAIRFSPCHSSSCFLALRGEVLVGAVWARPLFPPTASLLPSSSSLTGLYLSGNKRGQCMF